MVSGSWCGLVSDMGKTYIVAVSGGVDSVVLLDMLVKRGDSNLVVAHFDHGIREDSAEDAQFVKSLSSQYGLLFEMEREELGASASEELARSRRYAFLRAVADKYKGTIVTAHHMNDIAETIAINITRGTGWRGVAVLASDIYRPLLLRTKEELVEYAQSHGLSWHEDSTNSSDAYLRNRIRPKLSNKDTVRQLAALRARQVELRDEINKEISQLNLTNPYPRYFFIMAGQAVGMEALRSIVDARATRKQLSRALLAIATHKAGSKYELGDGILLHFTSRHFTVQMVK